jgi:hypothetical protein
VKKQLAFSIVFIVVGIIGLVVALIYKDYPIAVVIAFTTGFNLAMPLAHLANGTAKDTLELNGQLLADLQNLRAEADYWRKESIGPTGP